LWCSQLAGYPPRPLGSTKLVETRRRIEVARYVTENEGGGQVVVVEWVTITTVAPLSGRRPSRKRVSHWTLVDGSPVEYIDEHTFQIVESEEILRKIG
jgi:hypothetical protein